MGPLKLYYIALDRTKYAGDLTALTHPATVMLHNSIQRGLRKRPRSKASTTSSTPSICMSDDELPAGKVPKLSIGSDDVDVFKPVRQGQSDHGTAARPLSPLTTTPLSRDVIRPIPKVMFPSSHQKAAFPPSTSKSHSQTGTSASTANDDVSTDTNDDHFMKTPHNAEMKHSKEKKKKKKKKKDDKERNRSPSHSKSPSCTPLGVDTTATTPASSDNGPKKRSPTVTIRMKDIRGKTIFTVERKPDTDETTVKHNSASDSESDGDAYSFDGVIPGDSKQKKHELTKAANAHGCTKSSSSEMKPPAVKRPVPSISSMTMKPLPATSSSLTESLQLNSRHSTTITVGTKKLTVTPVPSPPPTMSNLKIISSTVQPRSITPLSMSTPAVAPLTVATTTTTPVFATSTRAATPNNVPVVPPSPKATHVLPPVVPTKLSAPIPKMSVVHNGAASNGDVPHVLTKKESSENCVLPPTVIKKNEVNSCLTESNAKQPPMNTKSYPQNRTVSAPILEKLANQKAMFIENKMAGFKLIKPKVSVPKEKSNKSISDIVNKLGENVSAKAKSTSQHCSTPELIEKLNAPSANAIQNSVLRASDPAQKRAPNVIPSLSSPKDTIQSGLSTNKNYMLTTDSPSEHVVNSQTNNMLEKDIELLKKSQSIKLHNNNVKPTLDNVNIVENDSDPVLISQPLNGDNKMASLTLNGNTNPGITNGTNGSTVLTVPTPEQVNEGIPTKVIQLNDKPSTSKTSPVPGAHAVSSDTPSQTLLIPDHINPSEMRNYQVPQPCKRRGTYAKKPTKSALARMSNPMSQAQDKGIKKPGSKQPSKMAKMAATLNARRGRQPIPIPGNLPNLYNLMSPQMSPQMFNLNQHQQQNFMAAAYAGQMARLANPRLGMDSGAAAVAVANAVRYNPANMGMMAGRPATPIMMPGHSPPGSLLHPTSSPGSSASSPTFAHRSPDGTTLHSSLPMTSPSFLSPTPPSFISPPSAFHTGNPPSHMGAIPVSLANGYDAPLDFTTKRSEKDSPPSTAAKAVKSPDRTLLKVPKVAHPR